MLKDRRSTTTFLAIVLAFALLSGCGSRYPRRYVSLPHVAPQSSHQSEIYVPILTFHRFGAAASDEMTVRDSTFEEQLRYLIGNGYTVIPLRSLVDYLRGLAPAPPPYSVVITADDGHKSVYSDMLPIARRYRIPVTLFIYPSAISNASYAMTWEELSELQKTGLFDVQSHTYWHPNFNTEKHRLTPAQYDEFVTTQLTKSKETLENELHTKVDLLAWPFGIVDEFLMMKALQSGYVTGFALGGRQASGSDPVMALPRYLITEADKDRSFERILRRPENDPDSTVFGKVTNRLTGEPIEGAFVTIGNDVANGSSLKTTIRAIV